MSDDNDGESTADTDSSSVRSDTREIAENVERTNAATGNMDSSSNHSDINRITGDLERTRIIQADGQHDILEGK